MSTPPAASPLPAVVLGGGLAGLAAARLLRRHFPRVVVLERDRRPETASPEDAFAAWERRGVPQFRHSHAFLARLRVVLLAHLPDVLDRLRAAGVREFGLDEVTPPGVTLTPRADDEDVVLLACRRSTFEWALRASVAGRPGIELGEGVVVEGLVGEARDGAPVDDHALRGLAEPARFERFLHAFPAVAPWRTRGTSVPIAGEETPVLVMGRLRNRLRRFVDRRGLPLATGFFAIGDAAYHSNPIYGRGAPSGLVQAALLDEALERHPRDLAAAARHLDRRSEAELRSFWEAAVAGDRRGLGERQPFALTNPRGWLAGVAEQAFGWFVDRALVPAMRVDPVVFRGLLRVFNMLDPPEQLLRDPELVLRALPVLARVLRGDEPAHLFPRVERDAVLARLAR